MSRSSIFVSYRREDAADAVGRMCDHLGSRFGSHAVFRDVDAIPIGADFPAHIRERLTACQVLLAVIGPHWTAARDINGVPRLDDPKDWVRVELETARSVGVPIVPVLISGATMPHGAELPESLRWVTELNAAPVRRDPDFHRDMVKLVDALQGNAIGVRPTPQGVVNVWDALRKTEDIDKLRRFIETFEGTAEAWQARLRIDQLTPLAELREAEAYFERCSDPGSDGEVAGLYQWLEDIDAFLDRRPDSEWDAEVHGMRTMAVRMAVSIGWYETADGNLYFYPIYEHLRDEERKPRRD